MTKGHPSQRLRKTDEIAHATDASAPSDTDSPSDNTHPDAVRDLAGRHPGRYATRYLDDLREEWPE